MSVNPTNKVYFFRSKCGKGQSILIVGAADVLQRSNEIIENFCRNHDAVAVGAHLFGDADHTPASVALEIQEEGLAVSNDFFGANDIVVHCFYTRGGYRKPLWVPIITQCGVQSTKNQASS